MCAFAGDAGPVELWEEFDGPALLQTLQTRMRAETNIAWNVGFERTLIKWVWKKAGLTWQDAMVHALYAGLPAGLKDCNRVPYFDQQAATSKETGLINKFCKPQKDGGVRNRETDPEDWALFCQYCRDDVQDTRLIYQWIEGRYAIPERVHRAWLIDQEINARGMPIDRLLTFRAFEEAQRLQLEASDDLKTLTGLDNPNSPAQLLKWVQERGYPYGGLAKELVQKALKDEPGGATDVDD